jgi:hypothetical protein
MVNQHVAYEVCEITEHDETLIACLDSTTCAPANSKNALLESFQSGIAAYADDFGQPAADQLEAYVKRQASLDMGSRRDR